MSRGRIQSFGKEQMLYVGDEHQKGTVLFYYIGMVRNIIRIKDPEPVKIVLEALSRATASGKEAVAATFIEADNQFEVIGFSEVGRLEKYAHMPWVTRQVQRARELATTGKTNIQLVGKKAPVVQTIEKSWICMVKFPFSDTKYTYRCRKQHIVDKSDVNGFVKVFSRKENKDIVVPVLKCEEWTENRIKEEARKFGYTDLTLVASDDVTQEEFERWEADNYEEDMDELQAMKECFMPRCDYVPFPDSNAAVGD